MFSTPKGEQFIGLDAAKLVVQIRARQGSARFGVVSLEFPEDVVNAMRLRILSDLHITNGDIQRIATIKPLDEDVLVCAGDVSNDVVHSLQWLRAKFMLKRIIFVLGNHEYYDSSIAEREYTAMEVSRREGIDVLINDTVEIDGVRFIGTTLWSSFELYLPQMAESMRQCERWINDFEYIKVNPNRRLSASYERACLWSPAYSFLSKALSESDFYKTVVVTHFAPCSKSVAPRYEGDICTPYFVNRHDDLIPKAKLWIHGHNHTAFDYTLDGARVICNPSGYAREPVEFNPDLIVEV